MTAMKKNKRLYTTRQVSEMAGITRATLQEWVRTKQVEAPHLPVPGIGARLWTDDDVRRVKHYKELTYKKGRGEAKRSTVRLNETVWRLNKEKCELSDGTRTFVFNPHGTYPPGRKSEIVPIAWEEKKASGKLVKVSDPVTFEFLDIAFRFINGRLRKGGAK
jgi:hypothetical protein